MRLITVLCLVVITSLASAKEKSTNWQTGILLSVGRKSWTETSGSSTNGQVDRNGNYEAHTTDSSWSYLGYQVVIDDGTTKYFGERTLAFRWQHEPRFTENAKVQFSSDGDRLVVVDETGKEFKMKLVKRRLDEPARTQ